jgi:hypothetical protein
MKGRIEHLQVEPGQLGRQVDEAAAALRNSAAVVTVPRLLTVSHTAAVLDCSTRTVRRRISEGLLPAVIEGDRLMVRGDDLAAYIDELERRGNSRRVRSLPQKRTYDFLRGEG